MTGFTRLLAVLAVLACLCAPALADQTWEYTNYPGPAHQGAGYLFTYWSLVQYGYGFPNYYYDYTLQNNSSQFDIVDWTWFSGTASGSVFPHPAGAEYVDGYDMPLLAAASDDDMQYRCEDNDSVVCPPVTVMSRIHWSDGHQTIVPVYVPQCVIPEPSSIASLLAGMVGAIGLAIRRKK